MGTEWVAYVNVTKWAEVEHLSCCTRRKTQALTRLCLQEGHRPQGTGIFAKAGFEGCAKKGVSHLIYTSLAGIPKRGILRYAVIL